MLWKINEANANTHVPIEGGRKEERGVGEEGAKRLAMSSGIRDSKA